MLVISVCGIYKNRKYFYYISEIENANGEKVLRFNNNLNTAITFNSLNSAMEWAKEHYLELLNVMASGSAKMLTKTLAIRKIVFKSIREINEDILSYEKSWPITEGEEDAEKEDTDAFDEISNNGSEFESGMETEMQDDGTQTSGSDIPENIE